MRKVASVWIVLATLLFSAAGAAADDAPRISMELDRKRVVVDEPFKLTITIEASSSEEPKVRLPQFGGGLQVLQQSRSTPMSFSFSMGTGRKTVRQTTRQNVFQFVLVAETAGEYTLKPVEIEIGGKRYRGDPFAITVGGAGPGLRKGNSVPPSAQPEPPAPDPVVKGVQADDDYFVQVELSKKRVVVGEKVVLTLYVYSAWDLVDAEVLREPGVEGFWLENLVGNRRSATVERVTVGNQAFGRVALRRMALFPIESGRLSISPAVVEIVTQRGGFFSRGKSVKRVSKEAFLEVAELPSDAQPAGFNPANVGQYHWSASVEPTSIRVGEPVTLRLQARGEGNLRNLVLPELTEVPGFKVYAPESDVDVNYAGDRVTGVREHRILMIPERSGTLTVPAVPWSYYDSARNAYQTPQSSPVQVEVLPAKQAVAPVPGAAVDAPTVEAQQPGSELVRLNRQLRSILSTSSLRRDRPAYVTTWWFWVLVLLPPMGLVTLMVLQTARRRARTGRTRDMARRADGAALSELSKLARQIGQADNDQIYGGLHRILIDFLERRLVAPVAGDTMAELTERLTARGFDAEDARLVVAELESSDFARFARSGSSADEQRQAIERAQQTIRRLARVKVREEEA